MQITSWKYIVEIVGIAAIVGSLIFVGFQLRQSEQIGISDAIANRNERENALRVQIIENAAVWHKACVGESLQPEERHVAAAIFDTYSDNLMSAWLTSRGGLMKSGLIQRRILNRAAVHLWAFPGLEKLRQTRTSSNELTGLADLDARVSGLYRGINNRLTELNESGAQPDIDISLCGLI